MSAIDDPGDDEHARARHQVRLLEHQVRALSDRNAELAGRVEAARDEAQREAASARLARMLRDAAAQAHEEERDRRYRAEGEVLRLKHELAGRRA